MVVAIKERLIRLLRWSEQYTKTDMVYLAHGGFLSLFGQGMALIASLALAVAVSHLVPKESYGIYKYTVSIVSILSLFSLNSIGSAVFQSAAQGYDGALMKGFRENIRWSAVIFLGALILGVYYFIMGNTTLGIGILIGGSLSPLLASASLFSAFLGGKKDFYRLTMYGILDNIIPIGIFIAVIFFTQNPLALIVAYFISNTLAALYFYRRTVAVYHAKMHLHDEGMLAYSKHLSAMGIVSGIATNIDQILLFHFVGAAELAIYNFATAIPDIARGPVKNLDNMVQARLVGHSGAEIQRSMWNKIFWYFVFTISLTLLYIAAAPLVFKLLFPSYAEAVWYSQLYMLWLIAVSLDPLSSYFSAKKLIREQYVVSFVYSTYQIAALCIGVIFWGLLGVILARVSTRVVVSTLTYFLYRRAIKREIASAQTV